MRLLVQDTRHAARALRGSPGFALAAILSLALGIGANTAIFTLIDALLLRPLPVPRAGELVTIGDPAAVTSGWSGTPRADYVSYPVYADVRDRNRVLAGLYATGSAGTLDVVARAGSPGGLTAGAAGGDASPDHPRGRLVTGNFFAVLGVRAALGRTFTADEDRVPLGDPVAVLGHGYWRRRFGGDSAVVGRTIAVNGTPITVVGVAPPEFTGDVVGQPTDLWLPMMMQPAIRAGRNILDDRSRSWLLMMGRLAPGVTLARARTELATLATRSLRTGLGGVELARLEEDLAEIPVRVESGERGFSRDRATYAPALGVLMAAVALVALVVCANVANLLLVRAVARGREMTVRMSLGAGRGRLVRQLLTESVLLAGAAALLGLLAAAWGSRLLLAVAAAESAAIPLDVAPDARALGFTAGVALACTLLFGLAPALRATRVDLATVLRAQGRGLAGARARLRRVPLGKLLVVAQIALSTLLLVGTGLLVRSMRHLVTADLGLDRGRLVVVEVDATRTGRDYAGARGAALVRDVVERAARVPGVVAASYSAHGAFTGSEGSVHVTVPGVVTRADSASEVAHDVVGPGYFRALGARLLRGRDFEERDVTAGASAAVINETMARQYFAGRDAIGATLVLEDTTLTVVGVARDVEQQDVRARPVRQLWVARAQPHDRPDFFLLLRTAGPPAQAVPAVRRALLAADPALSIDVDPLDALVRRSVAREELLTRVTAAFGLVALALTALGLYGVTAYATAQRTGELGVRLALGAAPGRVSRMVVGEALALSALGVGAGLPLGLAAAWLIRAQLFGVGPTDAPSLGVAAALPVAVALAASWLPARRAARVGPLAALRAE